jgi:hypothetical protein
VVCGRIELRLHLHLRLITLVFFYVAYVPATYHTILLLICRYVVTQRYYLCDVFIILINTRKGQSQTRNSINYRRYELYMKRDKEENKPFYLILLVDRTEVNNGNGI